jgi:hypothetical protein
MKDQQLKLPSIMESNVHSEDKAKAMLLRSRTGRTVGLNLGCGLAHHSHGAGRSQVEWSLDGSNQHERAPLQAYLTKAMDGR